MTTIREWRNEEWETGEKARSQGELQYMFRKIISSADVVENEPTTGHDNCNISRVLTCTNRLLPGTKYIIHITGFTVEDIVEIINED